MVEPAGLAKAVDGEPDPAARAHLHAGSLLGWAARRSAVDEFFEQGLPTGIGHGIGEVAGARAVAFHPLVEHCPCNRALAFSQMSQDRTRHDLPLHTRPLVFKSEWRHVAPTMKTPVGACGHDRVPARLERNRSRAGCKPTARIQGDHVHAADLKRARGTGGEMERVVAGLTDLEESLEPDGEMVVPDSLGRVVPPERAEIERQARDDTGFPSAEGRLRLAGGRNGQLRGKRGQQVENPEARPP